MPFDLDHCISEFDKGLRVLLGESSAHRPSPADRVADGDLEDAARRQAAALMRVNHCGEVCAQALYQGQALASADAGIKSALHKAADEEADHLAWSAQRVRELGGRLSVLNPLWYAGSLAIGFAAGRLGTAGALDSSRRPNVRSKSICKATLAGSMPGTQERGQ